MNIHLNMKYNTKRKEVAQIGDSFCRDGKREAVKVVGSGVDWDCDKYSNCHSIQATDKLLIARDLQFSLHHTFITQIYAFDKVLNIFES